MDRITSALLKEFANSQAITSLEESKQFEHLANYSVLFSELSETFDLDDVHIGEDGNLGIDGAAIIVNGVLVTSEEDAKPIIDASRFLDVDFIFIQAKTSASFDLGELGKFLFAVTDFFAENPKLPATQAMKDLMVVKDYLYTRSGEMTNRNPNLSMFYVCTGKWTNDANLRARIDSVVAELKNTGLFQDVVFTPIDASELSKLYRATKGKSSADFSFSYRVALPQQVVGVSEAHFGVVMGTEFLKLVTDENGNIKKSLFNDNVRDFQDYNDVNKDIRQTLLSTQKAMFPLLNNGITIIAGVVRPTGNVFHIEDYQIVNGCQTSHVLFHSRAAVTEAVYVPIKLISTENDEVVNKIIKATNFQTEVKPDQLYALSDFQKKLEEYYATFDGQDERLYYERRSKQYANTPHVVKLRIVTIQQQIRAFVSMFLNEPHRGHYPRSMSPQVGKALFGRDHLPDPYFISAFAQFRLEYFFRSGSIDKKYKPARYHLLMAVRHILLPQAVPAIASNEMKRYCAALLALVKDDERLLKAFRSAAALVVRAARGKPIDRTLTKTIPFSKRFNETLLAIHKLRRKAT